MELLIVIILGIILVVFGEALLLFGGDDNSLALMIGGALCISLGIVFLMASSRAKGIEKGAYNQLRGKYEITYVIDKDSCVKDTIINFN